MPMVSSFRSFYCRRMFENLIQGTVKKSVFFYQPGSVNYNYPSSIDWGNWWSWNEAAAFAIDRAYDYVHVTAAWWSLYRVARNYPTLLPSSWQTYLTKA